MPAWRRKRGPSYRGVLGVVVKPFLTGFEARNDRVPARMEVLGGVLVGGVVTASNVTTLCAASQMQPPLTRPHTFNAPCSAGRDLGIDAVLRGCFAHDQRPLSGATRPAGSSCAYGTMKTCRKLLPSGGCWPSDACEGILFILFSCFETRQRKALGQCRLSRPSGGSHLAGGTRYLPLPRYAAACLSSARSDRAFCDCSASLRKY
jgi:hypothetical protein